MGELSQSFNDMASALAAAREEIRLQTEALLEMNTGLRAEIAERRKAEEALRESESRYRALFENNHNITLLIEPETGEIVDANARACAFYGYRHEDLLRLKITDVNTLSPEEVKEEMQHARTGRRNYFNFRHRLANGDIRDVEVHSGPIAIHGRQLLYSLVHDTTERRRMEDLLRQSEIRYRTIFETTGAAMMIIEEGGLISLANAEFTNLTGCSGEEVQGKKNWKEFFVEDDLTGLEEWLHLRGARPPTSPWGREVRFVDKEGRRGNAFLTVAAIPGTVRVVASLLDTTEVERMKEELLQARKLQSVGILAGGVAHDFNNLLGAILGNLNLAGMDIPAGHPAGKWLIEAERASLQARDLTKRFLTLAAGGRLATVQCSITDLMADQVGKDLLGSGIEIECDFPADLHQVEIDPNLMRQAISNVLVNAMEAMPLGGTLRIGAENIDSALGGASPGLPMKAGRYVHVFIKDSGVGIPRENLARIFDPYFSTKDRRSDKGMGLGLALTLSVINKHGGAISVESGAGTGATVHILIPAAS